MSEYRAMRVIVGNLRMRGGQGQIHACYFPMLTYSEYLAAIYQLRKNGTIVYLGNCCYELRRFARCCRESIPWSI